MIRSRMPMLRKLKNWMKLMNHVTDEGTIDATLLDFSDNPKESNCIILPIFVENH
mgnify:CR=1 FL=1